MVINYTFNLDFFFIQVTYNLNFFHIDDNLSILKMSLTAHYENVN